LPVANISSNDGDRRKNCERLQAIAATLYEQISIFFFRATLHEQVHLCDRISKK